MTSPYPIEQRQTPATAAGNTTQKPDPSLHSGGVTAPPAISLPDPAQDNTYYDREDLKAQREMAKWTRMMGAAAVVGVVLSVLGVFLVWTTFAETRKSNEIAKSNQRPWLTFTAKITKPVMHTPQGLRFTFDVTIKNVGLTPARKAFLTGKMFNILRGGDAPESYISECADSAKTTKDNGFVLGPNEEITKRFQTSLAPDDFGVRPNGKRNATYPMVVFSVCYRATSDPRLHGQIAKGFLIYYADWVGISAIGQAGSVEIEELNIGEANNIGAAT